MARGLRGYLHEPPTFGRVLNAAMKALRALGSTNLAETIREHAF